MRLTILHTNDIHSHQDRLAQIATLVTREKARSDHAVLYLDAGDVEDTSNRLSNLTKGTAMHRLLSIAGCDAATVGNASWLRYGAASLTDHARASTYPQLLANFTGIEGPVSSVLLGEVGIVGVTDPFDRIDDVEWGFGRRDVLDSSRQAARDLGARGAKLVVLLSHLGYEHEYPPWDDRRIAPELQGDVDVIIGGHSHHLLPDGEWIGRILVAQAGCFGDHIGRIEIDGKKIVASVEEVPDDTELHPGVLAEAAAVETEIEELLAEPLGSLDEPLDARAIAEILRRRAGADIGIFSEGQTLEVLPAGRVTRGALWHASESAANPGLTRMTGDQLIELLERGNDAEFQRGTPRPLRGRPRGRLELVGATPEAGREYLVASTDWELGIFSGYVPEGWRLQIEYEFPLIVREAIEEHLRRGR